MIQFDRPKPEKTPNMHTSMKTLKSYILLLLPYEKTYFMESLEWKKKTCAHKNLTELPPK